MTSDDKPYDKIHGATADKAEPDIDPDRARANDRSTGGVPEPGAPDEASQADTDVARSAGARRAVGRR